jgi:hypothetical protein
MSRCDLSQPSFVDAMVSGYGLGISGPGNETGSQKRQTSLLTAGVGPLPKSPSEVGEDMGSSLVFRPHAIIATDRSVPSPS